MRMLAAVMILGLTCCAQTAKKPTASPVELAAANQKIIALQQQIADLKSQNDGLIFAMKNHYQLMAAYQQLNDKCVKLPSSTASKTNNPEVLAPH